MVLEGIQKIVYNSTLPNDVEAISVWITANYPCLKSTTFHPVIIGGIKYLVNGNGVKKNINHVKEADWVSVAKTDDIEPLIKRYLPATYKDMTIQILSAGFTKLRFPKNSIRGRTLTFTVQSDRSQVHKYFDFEVKSMGKEIYI